MGRKVATVLETMDIDFIYIIGPGGVRCPFCALKIPPDALICGFCRSGLSKSELWAQRVCQFKRERRSIVILGSMIVGIMMLFIALVAFGH